MDPTYVIVVDNEKGGSSWVIKSKLVLMFRPKGPFLRQFPTRNKQHKTWSGKRHALRALFSIISNQYANATKVFLLAKKTLSHLSGPTVRLQCHLCFPLLISSEGLGIGSQEALIVGACNSINAFTKSYTVNEVGELALNVFVLDLWFKI